MTPAKTATILRNYNEWLRGSDDALRPTTKEITEAIDAAVEMSERMEKMENALVGMLNEFNESTISGMVHNEWMACVNARAALEKSK
jgi:hypothetical protein